MIELPILGDHEESGASAEGPAFWRSFSHRNADAESRAMVQSEFMPGASDAPSGTSRRQFLQLMGASMALAGLTACRKPVEKILPYTRKPEEIIPGIPINYATGMPFRGVLRPVLVESNEGRPTKVEGNPEHPSSIGSTTVFEQASVLNLYDPDRSMTVLRDGSDATWEDFLRFVQEFNVGSERKRLAVLAAPSSSPTRRALREQLQQRYPQLRWVTYAAEGDDAVALGMQQAFGRPVRPRYQFSNADVIVSLDADFLGATDRDSLHNTAEFAASRRLDAEDRTEISRLYVAESGYSITGGMADNRLRLRSSLVPAFAAALANELGVAAGPVDDAFAGHPWITELARDLRQAGSRGVVLAGETQPPAVHALCMALNSALGSIGETVELLDVTDAPAESQQEGLVELVQAMNAGTVDALLILGANPVYDAPAAYGLAEAMARVGETIHLGMHVDETARAARWHLPMTHYLEAWGDGRSYDGTLSVIQPLIAPLFDAAHSDIEVLSAFLTGVDQTGYDLVREVWRQQIGSGFEQTWRRALHDGYLPDSGYGTVTASAAPTSLTLPPALGADELEVVFRLDPTVLDGSYANNAWLQETPDPATKIVWDNVAAMSPATAEVLGLEADIETGQYFADVIELNVGGLVQEIPVWIQPGLADGSIQLTLGYGREITSLRPERDTNFFDRDDYTDVYGQGAIGTGVGVNVGPLRDANAMAVAVGAQVRKVGDGYMLATTQDHGTLEGRAHFRLGTTEMYRENPGFVKAFDPKSPGEEWQAYPPLWEEHPREQDAYRDSPYYRNQWGMAIDLNTCTGCNACVVACQAENNIQVVGKDEVARGREMHWIRIDRYYVDANPTEHEVGAEPLMVMQPLPCMHCENAPCESVCPVAATVHSPDGTNQMIYNRCIGTRYCANNCPYKVRRFNFFNWTKTLPATVGMAMNPNVTVRSRGVMEKCSYCIQRVREANKLANIEDRTITEGEVQTACQQACPANAITFGDLNNPNSEVVQKKQEPRNYEMLAELAIKPRTSYLARLRNPNPRLAPANLPA